MEGIDYDSSDSEPDFELSRGSLVPYSIYDDSDYSEYLDTRREMQQDLRR